MTVAVPPLQGVINFRDLADAAPTIRPGRVFRSGRLCFATAADVAALEGLGIRTLLDLRSREEIDDSPDSTSPLEQACSRGAFSRHQIHLLDAGRVRRGMARILPLSDRLRAARTRVLGGRTAMIAELRPALNAVGLLGLNKILLSQATAQLTRALRLIAQPEAQPLVVYCTAGKDRTGLISALVLAILGIDEPAILANYARSHEHYERYLSDAAYGGRVLELGLDPQVFLAARPELMAQTLAHLDASHGGLSAWLDRAGFSDSERMRSALLG